MEKVKSAGFYFLCIAVGYLLLRVYAVTGERDHARELASAYKTSSEQSLAALGKIDQLDGKTQKLLILWEKQNGEIMLGRAERQQTVTEETRKNPAFASWRGGSLPALYQPGGGMLGQTGSYTDAGFHQSGSPGQPDSAAGGSGVARQN